MKKKSEDQQVRRMFVQGQCFCCNVYKLNIDKGAIYGDLLMFLYLKKIIYIYIFNILIYTSFSH